MRKSFVAMAIMVYALVTYHWRASAIRNKGSGPYDDRLGEWEVQDAAGGQILLLTVCFLTIGPTVLSVLLLIAVLVNFILRFQDNNN